MQYIIAILVAAIIGLGIYSNGVIVVLKGNVADLTDKVSTLQIEIANADRNTASCKLALAESSNALVSIKADYNNSVAKLNSWKKLPAEIRYNTIYKTITKVDYAKGECNDTKELISSISNINYNDL